MKAGWRGQLLLGLIGLIAVANAFLLALTLYGLLAAALHVLGRHAPSPIYAFLAGAGAAATILALSFRREQLLRRGDYDAWPRLRAEAPDPGLRRRAEEISRAALGRPAEVAQLESEVPNAFATAGADGRPTIVVTRGLLGLDPAERDAVLAHIVARIKTEDLRTIGLADAITGTITSLGRQRDRYLWSLTKILVELAPFFAVLVAGALLLPFSPPASGNDTGFREFALGMLWVGVVLAWFAILGKMALRSWRGLSQLFLFAAFSGPLTVVEWVLAPPTAAALARLLSRERTREADRHAIETTGNPAALVSALQRMKPVESWGGDAWQGSVRFSLFVTPRAQSGYRAWLERVTSTHPSIAQRIESLPQDESRPSPLEGRLVSDWNNPGR